MPPLATNHALDVPRASQGGVVAAMHLLWATATTKAAKHAAVKLWGCRQKRQFCVPVSAETDEGWPLGWVGLIFEAPTPTFPTIREFEFKLISRSC